MVADPLATGGRRATDPGSVFEPSPLCIERGLIIEILAFRRGR
ncbi:Uncharacterised protein [Mycobacterium tuberculosis]|uniref:Uncharacterized protein n=1 Tax=Mycobacterium tuberculosis TaxID=1773 RepID=A0A655IDC8_MYCTX|nr:Uncharacterised protein [Mycobacterium tuberculosis]COV76688.1 Uncharacterised protein [Mycobacterium tuberculosis]COW38305.1 Uncharacterised protein [Mycobacterium tuberculosis]